MAIESRCNECGEIFNVGQEDVQLLVSYPYEVQYIICPHCGSKYHVLTTDVGMRELIAKRVAIQQKIRAAHNKRFRKVAIQSYYRELEIIKSEQKALEPTLRNIGEAMLLYTDKQAHEKEVSDGGGIG